MGVQLDWDIESDNQNQAKQHTEDGQIKLQRYGRFIRLFAFITIIFIIAGLIIWFATERLQQVENRLEGLLRDTVQAEVASIRIGDISAFKNLQRSQSPDWHLTQEVNFNRYQALKANSDIQLTGRIESVEIDGTRARVVVEEIIEGVPYLRTWFYWRYDDEIQQTIENGQVIETTVAGGWYHVPPDYTFWGETLEIRLEYVTIRYQSLDESFAEAVATKSRQWFVLLCQVIDCNTLPTITFDIVANTLPEPIWTQEANQWQLIIPSPYATQARADMPLTSDIQLQISFQLVSRFMDTVLIEPQYPTDAYYLDSAIRSWLIGQFAEIETNSFLITSLASNYGVDRVGRLITQLQPTSSMAILAEIVGVNDVNEANLDWRDLLTWRIVTEYDLLALGDHTNYFSLYLMSDEAIARIATDRFNNANDQLESPVVVRAVIGQSSTNTIQLQATVQDQQGTESIILYTLVDNFWLRSN